MTETKAKEAVTYQDVELLCDEHTHRRTPYKKGAVLRLRSKQAARMIEGKSAKKAAADAKPANVDEDGNLV